MILQSDKRFDEKIGLLVSHMIQTREKTKSLVVGLSVEDLDFNFDSISNSLGTLLLHIAALEFNYQRILFLNRSLNNEEFKKYKDALPGHMYTRNIKKNNVEFYFQELDYIRLNTLKMFSEINDEWLYKEKVWSNQAISNNLYLVQHLIDDEISHQGQMKWIKLRLNSRI